MAATVRSFRDYLRQRALKALGVLMSLNDPQWGRRPGGGNQGPPDLEELWRNFNRKLEGLFSRRRGGEPPSGGPRPPRRLGGGAGLIA
ncbi:MAG: protease modulator HflK N-terminal domain-containing protein, partial [Burkholderiales bacterium]